jgi:hypothetical protein
MKVAPNNLGFFSIFLKLLTIFPELKPFLCVLQKIKLNFKILLFFHTGPDPLPTRLPDSDPHPFQHTCQQPVPSLSHCCVGPTCQHPCFPNPQCWRPARRAPRESRQAGPCRAKMLFGSHPLPPHTSSARCEFWSVLCHRRVILPPVPPTTATSPL